MLSILSTNTAKRALEFFHLFYTVSRTLLNFLVRMSCEAWYGHRHEDSKVITHRASVRRAVKKCSVHFVPIAATVVLAGLNIGEYFIGSEYKGPDSGRWQDFDKLSLQLAAKLYVSSVSYQLYDLQISYSYFMYRSWSVWHRCQRFLWI